MPNIKGSIENLRRQLRSIRFSYDVNFQGMVLGQSSAFVEFYRHLLCDYNAKVTSYLVELGFGMLGTTDSRFMEVLYRILRDLFSYRPSITMAQFFVTGFAERKIEMATTVALHIGSLIKHQDKNRIHSNYHHQRQHESRHHNDQLKNADLNSRDQHNKFKNEYAQYKHIYHPSHSLDNNNPRRCYTSHTLYENCTKVSDHKLTATDTTGSVSTMNVTPMVPIRSLDALSDFKQHSKENYDTSSFKDHNSNTNEHLLISSNDIPSVINRQDNQSSLMNHEDLQNIMNSLFQLTGKVNGMLTRINKLESRLTNVETDCSFNHRSRTYSGNTVGSNQHLTDSIDIYGSRNIVNPTSLPHVVTGKYSSYLPMNSTNSLFVTSNSGSSTLDTFNKTIGTKTNTTTNTVMSSLTVTTATSYADRHILNHNNKLSEYFLSKPKYSTSTKLDLEDNNDYHYSVASNQATMNKTENQNVKISINDNHQSIKNVPNAFNSFHDSYKFNENCYDLSSRNEIPESVHSKYADTLRTINHRSSKLLDLNTCSLVDLDLQSEIQSPSFGRNNSALPYRPKSSADYSVRHDTSNPSENSYGQNKMMIPSLPLNSSPKSVESKIPTNQKSEASYRAQVERITNMLAETQNLLQEHPPVVRMNEMLSSNNNITTNDDSNNAVILKA
ncbi:asparagine-rich antigen, putative [Schistosoma mansoni]|uniref:asparagine-rich antigen, putative n=1 Tax=Schistosoma mansoni TaxID=6183 RepID=UPI0001A63C04|nr:asparagine-rich antigen, putative [Schistosoma mansoni]|eukprot:XP_018647090.1 asparagine-rich antigen, putative [Schistosoma mansoni]